VQVAATRQSLLQKFDQAQRRRFDHGAAADNQRIEIRIVERLRRDAHADRGTNGPASLGQQTQVIDRLAHLLVRVFKDRHRGEAHHLKAGEDDETEVLHGASPHDVLKRRLCDI
jgi:hypothetical protein